MKKKNSKIVQGKVDLESVEADTDDQNPTNLTNDIILNEDLTKELYSLSKDYQPIKLPSASLA
jgi:hypothetical protein